MPDFDTPNRRIFSVSEINNETKKLLEQRFFSLFIQGEVSNFSAPRSGHWYFTLKDDAAQIKVVMFKQANFKHQTPKLGDELIVGGQLSFYRERGEVQIIANQIRPAGLGDLQKQFEKLKATLLSEGLFDKSQKKTLPAAPKKIAVITSPTGAVVRDVAQVCKRRASALSLLVVPVRVQGREAENEICEAIKQCNARKDIDLIILARGGGSLEDFVAFNSENVARSIAESGLPVISGVGHETDISIADFVADVRAATPSEAAELATEGYLNIKKQLLTSLNSISTASKNLLLAKKNQYEKLSLKIKNPSDELRQTSQKLDHVESQLIGLANDKISMQRLSLASLQRTLDPHQLSVKVTGSTQLLSQLGHRLTQNTLTKMDHCKDRFSSSVALLEAINPLSTMTRGYSITFNLDNKVIQSVQQVTEGQKLKVRLKDGILESNTEKVVRQTET